MESNILIGREQELQAIKANLANKKHTLLIGDIGTGKSHLLKALVKDLSRVIYIEHIQPLKSALVLIAQELHKDLRLKLEDTQTEYLDWPDLKRKVIRLPIMELLACIVQGLEDQNYILILDHLEGLTPSMAFIISVLMDKTQVLAATNDLKTSGHLQRIWWKFEQVDIKNLDKPASRELLWSYADKEKVQDQEMFENKVLTTSAGNPLAIVEMAKRTQDETFNSTQKIRDLEHQAGIRYFDLTPALLILGAVVIAARFISLGLNDVDGYILAGIFGAFFIFLRYFIYRSMRKT